MRRLQSKTENAENQKIVVMVVMGSDTIFPDPIYLMLYKRMAFYIAK